MKFFWKPANLFYLVLVSFMANCFVFVAKYPLSLLAIIPLFLFVNLFAGLWRVKTRSIRLRICHHGGVMLCLFMLSLILSLGYHIWLGMTVIPDQTMTFVWSLVVSICVEAVIFWNGIICVYCTSTQLGIKWRVIGVICGWIPVANLLALNKILLVMEEVDFEVCKEWLNESRKDDKICKTKYPLLLVHGVFFRDSKLFNYWGRVPKELERNGATIYYGNHPSALSVEESGKALAERVREIVKETGCEKVNIIAHSKGGLDCRYALSLPDIAPMVASLTTINSPHRGCLFADKLLTVAPAGMKDKVAAAYNGVVRRLGEKNADFLTAVADMTFSSCERRNALLTDPEGVYIQSVGSRLNKATNGQFPLNLSYHLVKVFDGANDGLVGEGSFAWGEDFRLVTVKGKRGVSHGDMIDLNRENIKGFDVREFYVTLVKELAEKGL